jgi:hypothetical protein
MLAKMVGCRLLIVMLTIGSALEFVADDNDQLIIISNSSARAYLATAAEYKQGLNDNHRVVLKVGVCTG